MPEGGFDPILEKKLVDHLSDLRQDLNVLVSVNTRQGRALWQDKLLKNGMPLTERQTSELRHYFTGNVIGGTESFLAILPDSPELEPEFVGGLNHIYLAGKAGDKDPAAVTGSKLKVVDGGIDLNSDRMDLQRTGQRSHLDWGMSPADLENVQINGLVPVIIQITPVQDLPVLLGVSHQ